MQRTDEFLWDFSAQQSTVDNSLIPLVQCLSYNISVLSPSVMQIVNDSVVSQADPCSSHSLLRVTVLSWSMRNEVAALWGQLIIKVTLMILVNMRQSQEFRPCFGAKLKSDFPYGCILCHPWTQWNLQEFPLVPGVLSSWNRSPGIEAEKLFLHTCLPVQ